MGILKGQINRSWFFCAALSIFPILLFSYLCCNYKHPASLLVLFFVEWVLVLLVWRLLCPWLAYKSVLFAAIPYLFSVFVSAVLVGERIRIFGVAWYGSDDYWYLGLAERVVDSVHLSWCNWFDAWQLITLESTGGASWTVAGWPFFLGIVSSYVTLEPAPEMLHAIALSINATFLSILLALIFFLLGEFARKSINMVFVCFFLLIGDPIVYASQCLKESMLQVSLMLLFVFCVEPFKHIKLFWIFAVILGFFAVLTTRPVYVLLMLFILYWQVMDKARFGVFFKIVVAFVLLSLFGGLILSFNIRGFTLNEWFLGKTLIAEEGIGMSIYRLPLIGRVLFYALSPVPPLPWNILSYEQLIVTIIRSIGSMAWFFSACYVFRGVLSDLSLFKNKIFLTAMILFLGLFTAVVITGDDPRYKQPTNFYLAILLFLTWQKKRECRKGFTRIDKGFVEA